MSVRHPSSSIEDEGQLEVLVTGYGYGSSPDEVEVPDG